MEYFVPGKGVRQGVVSYGIVSFSLIGELHLVMDARKNERRFALSTCMLTGLVSFNVAKTTNCYSIITLFVAATEVNCWFNHSRKRQKKSQFVNQERLTQARQI